MIKITPKKTLSELDWLDYIRKEKFPDYTFRYNEEQKVGCGRDATFIKNKNEIKVELKDDLISEKYGNLFIEFAQTFNGEKTWLQSGLMLAAEQSDIYIHLAYENDSTYIYFFHPKKLLKTLKESCFDIKKTQPGKNGNRKGAYAKGWTVPFSRSSRLYNGQYGVGFKSFDQFYEENKYD